MTPRIGSTLAALLALTACSHGGKTVSPPSAAQPVAASEVDAIIELLDRGERDDARKRVRAALKRDGDNPSLRVLSDSIDRDPKDLLGPDSFPYTVRGGDTMIGLAERFLGNRLKAYQLARYNGIDTPRTLAAGHVLRIPGEPPRIEAPRKLPPAPVAARPAPSRVKALAARPVAPAANPAGAQRLRATGLAALNGGAPARAVLALRRAASLDPGNALIARDLSRAERIAAAVRARK
jgi:hypothetical protein